MRRVLTAILLIFTSVGWGFNPWAGTASASTGASGETGITRRVFLLIYDPILSDGKKLSVHQGWQDVPTITGQISDFFTTASGGKLQYDVTYLHEFNVWPRKVDGFRYTEASYMQVMNGTIPHHEPDTADYFEFMNDPTLDICSKFNQGLVDELWVFGAPWFGYYESRLTGPEAFEYNSPPLAGTTCNAIMPIMGFSYEVTVANGIHNFGHRMEATMTQAYAGWAENRTTHNWDRFGLVKFQSPAYDYSGCGSIHYPPNAVSGYEYDNPTSVDTTCEDFLNYPNLGEPEDVKEPVTCTAWDCTDIGYYEYWFGHLPSSAGTGPDGLLNDWWQYFINPNLVQKKFFNLSALLDGNGDAHFSFGYYGASNGFSIDLSTTPDFSSGGYESFGIGYYSPIIESNPHKWDQYTCDRHLYWRIADSISATSPVHEAIVYCNLPVYSNLSADLGFPSPAVFSFDFTGTSGGFTVYLSTQPAMNWDVYLNFGSGPGSPITVNDPTKWEKYTCGMTFYWKVISQEGRESEIQRAAVACPYNGYLPFNFRP